VNPLLILPILIPLCSGCLLLLGRHGVRSARGLALLSALAQLVLAVLLVDSAGRGDIQVYALGNWPPPQGIVLVLDRLAALMLLVTAVLALPVLIFASTGADRGGRFFHPLLQFQLVGINGAFLTGDLFNLFVFFEILLIASYGLLLHGLGAQRTRAGLQYSVLNLVGSSLFLIAAGLLYGITGTLNLAGLSVAIAVADPADAPLLATAGLLLLVVFGLKAALFPLYFWLPRSYSAACAPVAALFAIMTKVGVYAILRLGTLLFGAQAGALAGLLQPWLWPLSLITLALGAAGTLAAGTLPLLTAYLVVTSVGTLLSGIALHSAAAVGGALYYLLHTTWLTGALFLLADLIAERRGASAAILRNGPRIERPALLGGLYLIGAIALAGLPPLSGFVGKLLLLQAAPSGARAWLWSVLLGSGLFSLVALSRAGSALFWRSNMRALPASAPPGNAVMAVVLLLSTSVVLSIAGEPVIEGLRATAAQALDARQYTGAVLEYMEEPR